MRVLVAGASGFLGTALVKHLISGGHEVVVASRNPEKAGAALGVQGVSWNPAELGSAVENADAVVNLAGENVVAKRWDLEFKEKLRSSRVEPTKLLSKFKPKVLVQASAIGLYGERDDAILTEKAPGSFDFFGRLCADWEASASADRLAIMRIGQVLGHGGGALEAMLNPPMVPFSPWKLGLGGPLGTGNQWMAWIHLDDVVSALVWALENPEAKGAYNLTAPNPVTNKEFAATLGKVLGKPSAIPVPEFALRALLGEFTTFLLASQRVVPEKLLAEGFAFRFPDALSALEDLLAMPGSLKSP